MYYDELNRIKFNTTKNTHVIILKYHNLDFKIKKKSYNLKLFGKTMIDTKQSLLPMILLKA